MLASPHGATPSRIRTPPPLGSGSRSCGEDLREGLHVILQRRASEFSGRRCSRKSLSESELAHEHLERLGFLRRVVQSNSPGPP